MKTIIYLVLITIVSTSCYQDRKVKIPQEIPFVIANIDDDTLMLNKEIDVKIELSNNLLSIETLKEEVLPYMFWGNEKLTVVRKDSCYIGYMKLLPTKLGENEVYVKTQFPHPVQGDIMINSYIYFYVKK